MTFLKKIYAIKAMSFKAFFPTLALATLFFSACLDDNDSYNSDSQTVVAAITTINASPSKQNYDFYTDVNSLVNNDQEFKYSDQIRYKNFYSGNREFGIYKAGTNTNPVLDSVLAIENGKFQTLFLAGTSDKLCFVLLNDGTLEQASAGKAKIRYVNLSPDAGELSLGVKDATSLLASNKKYKEYSDFQETNTGSLKLDLTNATGTLLKEIILDAKDGYLYTVYSKGFLSGNEDYKIDLDTLNHYSLAKGY